MHTCPNLISSHKLRILINQTCHCICGLAKRGITGKVSTQGYSAIIRPLQRLLACPHLRTAHVLHILITPLTFHSIRDGTVKCGIMEKSTLGMVSEKNPSGTERRKYSNESPCECPSVHAVQ